MKTRIVCVTVAFLCCGISPLFAQMSILENSGSSRSVQRNTRFDAQGFPVIPVSGQLGNPFDLLKDSNASPVPTPSQPAPPPPTVSAPAITPRVSEPVAEISDPNALPVNRNVNPVDRLANYGTIDSIPNAAMQPVDWCYGMARTPNPVAEVLLREECVEGLWDGYAAQRAAECAYMWCKLSGGSHCQCKHGGCKSGCCKGGCQGGGCAGGHCDTGCDSCGR